MTQQCITWSIHLSSPQLVCMCEMPLMFSFSDKAVPLRLRSKSSSVIAVSHCLYRQTAPVLHRHLRKLPSHTLIPQLSDYPV